MATYTRNTLTGSLAPVNNELEKIEQALNDKFDRRPSVGQNTELVNDLDANSNRIINLAPPSGLNDAVRLKDLSVASGQSFLPVQEGQAGNILSTDGESAFWRVGEEIPRYVDTFDAMDNLSPNEGAVLVCTERASAVYIVQASGYVALTGDATFANGLIGKLQTDNNFNASQFANIEDAFNRAKSYAGSIGSQYPSDNQVSLYIPSGRYNAGGDLITLSLGVTGMDIYGDGNTSQLENIQIEMKGAARCTISNLFMRGALGNGIISNKDGTGNFLSRQNMFTNLYIRDKVNGVVMDGSTHNTWNSVFVEKCSGDGWRITETSGEQISNSYSLNNLGNGVYMTSGGEAKLTNFLSRGNSIYGVHLYGTDASTVVEHYFTNLTSTGQKANRELTITSIVDGGGFIRVTSAGHNLAEGMTGIVLSGTANYDGTYEVTAVYNNNEFLLDAAYIADEATGTINLPNWDLVIESDSTNNARVNDQFFTGGNINYTRIIKAFNVQFNGTRLKNQFYLDGDSALINRTGMSRGRNGNTFSSVEASGDTTGLIEEIFGSKDGSTVGGDEFSRKTVAGTLLNMDNEGVQGSAYYSGNSGMVNDDTVFSFTPQFSRGAIKVTNGAGQNARIIDLAYNTETPSVTLAGHQGAATEFTTGALTGTTGTDAKITVSAHTDGRIYLENRNGNQTLYWTIFR